MRASPGGDSCDNFWPLKCPSDGQDNRKQNRGLLPYSALQKAEFPEASRDFYRRQKC